MLLRIVLALIAIVVAIRFGATRANAAPAPSLPPSPHTVGMNAAPTVDLIEAGIAAFKRGDLHAAQNNFARPSTCQTGEANVYQRTRTRCHVL
jgi:hypothetical protein